MDEVGDERLCSENAERPSGRVLVRKTFAAEVRSQKRSKIFAEKVQNQREPTPSGRVLRHR